MNKEFYCLKKYVDDDNYYCNNIKNYRIRKLFIKYGS